MSGDALELIKKNVEHLIREEELFEYLRRGKPLVVKFGIDPTAAQLHLGHAVILRKLYQLQQMGHEINFIIGDFTARIGDPSNQHASRPTLSQDQIIENIKTYTQQISKILDIQRIKIIYNASWLGKLTLEDIMRLLSFMTVGQVLQRDDFRLRYEKGKPLTLLEVLYPLLQGYDSVVIRADIEVGGSDQLFNMLVGRHLQAHFGMKPQVVLTMPLLEGTDGKLKMSKTYNNFIGIDELPDEIFGKLLSISDELIPKYFRLLTDLSEDEIQRHMNGDPFLAKLTLAQQIVSWLYGESVGCACRERFERTFRQREFPENAPVYSEYTDNATFKPLIEVLYCAGVVKSKSEARRLIAHNAVKVDGERITNIDYNIDLTKPHQLRIGKHRFLKVVPRCGTV